VEPRDRSHGPATAMRKLINDPFAVVDEMVDGLAVAFPERIELTPSHRGVVSTRRADSRRVGIVVGGGSGHEPAFFGWIGPGLADGAALGNVFASPSARPIVEVAEQVDRDAGVLFVYGNYEGDVMNFEMASELLDERGIPTLHVRVSDDVASAPPDSRAGRRGVAGDIAVLKVAGARADEGASLEEVHRAATHANDRTRTAGVGLGPCIVPAAGRATFELPDGWMDVGMGVHGEAGLNRTRLAAADDVADLLLDLVLPELPLDASSPVWVLVNTLGATPLMEALIVLRAVARRLDGLGIRLHAAFAGEYITSLEMAGLSLTLIAMDDDLARLLDAPAHGLLMPSLRGPW
jgi:phosphoenolpyruvate---glycerone phosphotransferase subunit DhaK